MHRLLIALATLAMFTGAACAGDYTPAPRPAERLELPKPIKARQAPVRMAAHCSNYLEQCSSDSDCCSKNCVEISGLYACAMYGK